jgi:hypothetical protein
MKLPGRCCTCGRGRKNDPRVLVKWPWEIGPCSDSETSWRLLARLSPYTRILYLWVRPRAVLLQRRLWTCTGLGLRLHASPWPIGGSNEPTLLQCTCLSSDLGLRSRQ